MTAAVLGGCEWHMWHLNLPHGVKTVDIHRVTNPALQNHEISLKFVVVQSKNSFMLVHAHQVLGSITNTLSR